MKIMCTIFLVFFLVSFTAADTTVPAYPEILNKKELEKEKKISQLQGETEIVEYLTKIRKQYKKIDQKKFDLNYCLPKEKSTYTGLNGYFKIARQENKDVTKCKLIVDEFIKDAETLEKEYNKGTKKLTHSDSRKHLKKMITAAEKFSVDLRNALSGLNEEIDKEKEVVARRIKIVQESAKTFIENGLRKADEFIKKIQEAEEIEKTTTFNSGINKVARDLTQNISNILKYRDDMGDAFKDINDLDDVQEIIVAWGNDGRKVGDKGGKDNVEDELKDFVDTIAKIQQWYNKQ